MAEAKLFSSKGKLIGKVSLPDEIFGIEPNVAVMHQVVTAQRAAARSGSHSTKRRGEVRGGGAKPWRQKGTGRARAGSIRSPLWVGGGVAHGPKPRNYAKRIPKKMKKLALRSALSDVTSRGAMLALEVWPFDDEISTKQAASLFESMGVAGRKILAVVEDLSGGAALSVRNLPWVKPIRVDQLNTYDVVDCEFMVADVDALERVAGNRLEVSKEATEETDEEEANEEEETEKATEGDPVEADDGKDDS